MIDENEIKRKLLTRVMVGADDETCRLVMAMGSEMTLLRLLVAVAKIDPHLSVGLLVLRYGVTPLQAKKARNQANKKMED